MRTFPQNLETAKDGSVDALKVMVHRCSSSLEEILSSSDQTDYVTASTLSGRHCFFYNLNLVVALSPQRMPFGSFRSKLFNNLQELSLGISANGSFARIYFNYKADICVAF